MRSISVLGLSFLLALALTFGCSDDTEKTLDTGAGNKEAGAEAGADLGADSAVDTGTTDSAVPDIDPSAVNMGEGCDSKKDCKAGSPDCLMYSNIFTYMPAAKGICTKKCTADDPNTPLVDEDNCAKGFKCAAFAYTSATYYYCLKTCTPSMTTNPCPASSGQTCHPASTRWGNSKDTVCIYPACKTNKDCPVFTGTTCASDADCTKVKAGSFCEASSGKCALDGNCTKGGICGDHKLGKTGAKVGDPCKSDLDCPNAGTCFEESTATNAIGKTFRNGYCAIMFCSYASVLPGRTCPTGSTCHRLYYGGACMKSCTLTDAKTCRSNAADKGGDYECYGWNNLQIGGTAVAKTPVCTSAATQTCDSLGTTLNCSHLGTATGNTTNMSCRDRHTGVKKAKANDATGVCLDDTKSGAFDKPAVDAGTPTPDASTPTPDAGTPTPDATTPTPDAGTPTPDAPPAPQG